MRVHSWCVVRFGCYMLHYIIVFSVRAREKSSCSKSTLTDTELLIEIELN